MELSTYYQIVNICYLVRNQIAMQRPSKEPDSHVWHLDIRIVRISGYLHLEAITKMRPASPEVASERFVNDRLIMIAPGAREPGTCIGTRYRASRRARTRVADHGHVSIVTLVAGDYLVDLDCNYLVRK